MTITSFQSWEITLASTISMLRLDSYFEVTVYQVINSLFIQSRSGILPFIVSINFDGVTRIFPQPPLLWTKSTLLFPKKANNYQCIQNCLSFIDTRIYNKNLFFRLHNIIYHYSLIFFFLLFHWIFAQLYSLLAVNYWLIYFSASTSVFSIFF